MNPARKAHEFIAVWHRVLREWLSWPEPRIERFISRFRTFIEPEWHSDRTPIFFLAHALLPPSLHQRYQGLERLKIEREIEAAIDQHDPTAYLQPTFDWEAARERVKAVLVRYSSSLPRPDDLTWWERELQETPSLCGSPSNLRRHHAPSRGPLDAKPSRL